MGPDLKPRGIAGSDKHKIDYGDLDPDSLESNSSELDNLEPDNLDFDNPDPAESQAPIMKGARLAIIGRPNVGKSTLFNRLAGKKLAIVNDQPGVTRDIRETRSKMRGHNLILMDTAGFENAKGEKLEARMRVQTEGAVRGADICLFIYDAREGVTPLDRIFADFVRKTGKPTILVANKCESRAGDAGINEGYSLGMGDPIEVAAEHNIGFTDLDDAIELALRALNLRALNSRSNMSSEQASEGDNANLEATANDDIMSQPPVRIAIVGRPNAGKSTLINTLINQDRLLTGPEAGVTRDSITIDYIWQGRRVQFHDTAGLRKKAKIHETLEMLSVQDSLRAIKFAQVVVLLMDATMPFDKQDMQIANLCEREGRALVLGITKWDLAQNKSELSKALREKAARLLPQLRGMPVIMFSGLTGKSVDRLLPAIERVQIDWSAKLKTSELNDWLTEKVQRHPPPAINGRRIKPKYISQTKTRPPTFVLKCSRATKLPESYRRYLINGLRDDFDLMGVPIRLLVKADENPYDRRKKIQGREPIKEKRR